MPAITRFLLRCIPAIYVPGIGSGYKFVNEERLPVPKKA
jgi:hypothetical protein